MKKKCGYSKCEVEFDDLTRNQNKEFCCNSHRVMAGRERSPKLGDVTVNHPTTDIPIKSAKLNFNQPSGLDFNTQVSFQLIQKEADRWEEEYKKERDKREKLADNLKALEKEYSDFKQTKEIEAIKGEKPSALAGFAESSFVKEIMPHVAPHIGELVGFFKDKAIGSTNALGATTEDQAIQKWVSEQSPETQQALRVLITSVAGLNDEKTIQSTLVNLINLIQKGGPINTGKPAFSATGTFGYTR